MDQLDKAIIMRLSQACRVSYSELAREFNVTVNSIKNRINSLREEGIIGGFTVQLNSAIWGANSAIITFHLQRSLTEGETTKLGAHPNISAIGVGLDSGYIVALYRTNEELSQVADLIQNYRFMDRVEILPILPPLGVSRRTPSKSLQVLSSKDWEILRLLRNDGRMTLNALSKSTDLPSRSIRRRLEFMRKHSLIEETILLNPGVTKRGLMIIFQVTVPELTKHRQIEIERKLREGLGGNFWVSWKVVDRPILLMVYYVDNFNELEPLKEKISQYIPEAQIISEAIGGRITYFRDFRDEILETQTSL